MSSASAPYNPARMDWKPLTGHLSAWDAEKAIPAGEAVKELMEHPGWEPFLESASAYSDLLQRQLMLGKARENPAEYATEIGHMRGLGEITALAAGVVKNGHDLERQLHEQINAEAEEAAA